MIINLKQILYSEYISKIIIKLILISLFITGLPYSILFYLAGAPKIGVLIFCTTLIILCSYFLSKYSILAFLITITMSSLTILYTGSLVGREIGVQYLYFAFIATSFSIFSLRHIWALSTSCIISIGSFIFLEFTHYNLLGKIKLAENFIPIIKIAIILTTFVIIIFSFVYFIKFSSKGFPINKESIAKLFLDYNLTKREVEIVFYLLSGASNKEISKKCFIELTTVKTHTSNIFYKLEVSSRVSLMSKALNLI